MHKNERLPKLDSSALRTFLAVADHASVTHAAGQLHKTQSAVSVQIRQLETTLDANLFVREARGMALTTAGERLLRRAHKIVLLLDQTAADFVQEPIRGEVLVGIPDDYGTDLIASILADFANRHPAIEVSIRAGLSVEFPSQVEDGKLDLAVFASDQPGGGQLLLEEPTVWVSSTGATVAIDKPIPLALFDRSCWWRDAALNALDNAGLRWRIAYSSESVAGIKAAVSAGLAIGMLARSSVDDSMRILGPSHGLPLLPSSDLMLLGDTDTASPAVKAMADTIRRRFTRNVAS